MCCLESNKKNQKNIGPKQEKNQSTETIPEMTEMMELAASINVFHMFKKVEECRSIIRNEMEDKKRTKWNYSI